jgi:4-hydroxybenzoate polyprenyltransferase
MLKYLRLVRLPNVFTALADIWAGYLIMHSWGRVDYGDLAELCGISACLYMAGMAFNDVADWKEDALTRPNRPIPSGQISVAHAILAGAILLLAGLLLAAHIQTLAFTLAVLLAAYILLYDFLAKGVAVLGALTLGLCRCLNILLGMSTSANLIQTIRERPLWQGPVAIAIAAGCYAAGVTAFSVQEEEGQETSATVLGWVFCSAGILLAGSGCLEFYGWICFAPLAAALILLSAKLMRLGTSSAARDLVRAGVMGICVFDAGLLLGNTQPPAWLSAAICVALIAPGLLLAKLLAQKEA